jgi:hypothetical protein
MASILTPREGTKKECITSKEETSKRIGTSMGNLTELSTSRRRKGTGSEEDKELREKREESKV